MSEWSDNRVKIDGPRCAVASSSSFTLRAFMKTVRDLRQIYEVLGLYKQLRIDWNNNSNPIGTTNCLNVKLCKKFI